MVDHEQTPWQSQPSQPFARPHQRWNGQAQAPQIQELARAVTRPHQRGNGQAPQKGKDIARAHHVAIGLVALSPQKPLEDSNNVAQWTASGEGADPCPVAVQTLRGADREADSRPHALAVEAPFVTARAPAD